MVVKEALQRRVASLLRPWFRQEAPIEAPIELELGFFRCRCFLRDLELDVSALNEALMRSSTLLIQSATVRTVDVTFMPWRNPVLTLEIHGLHIVTSPRPLDDEFWKKRNQQWKAELEQKKALLHIDPQGSALHAAVERVTGIRPSRDLIVTLLTNMILQCAKIDLNDISVELLLAVKAPPEIPAESSAVNSSYGCCLSIKKFIVGDGYYRQSHSPGGFLTAAMISFFFSYRVTEGSKMCSIEALGLELKKPEAVQLHSVEGHDKYIIFLENLMVSVKLSHLQLTDLEFGIPEATVGLCPRNLNKLMIMLKDLNPIDANTMALVKDRQHKTQSKHLWHRAFEHVRSSTPKRRLQKLVETAVLALHYFQAYESWLWEVGWVLKEFPKDFRSNRAKSKRTSSQIEGRWKKVRKMEKDLPMEAVGLVRRVARGRVLAQLQLDNLEGESTDCSRKKYYPHLPLVRPLFSSLSGCLRKLVGGIYAFILYFYITLRNLVFSVCSLLDKGSHCQSGERSASVINFCTTKHNKKPCNFTGLYYRVNLCKVAITVTCNDINNMTLPGKIEDVPFSSIAGSSIGFVLKKLCLLYALNENTMEFSLVCGELKGHICSASSNNKREGRDLKGQIFSSFSNNQLEGSGSKLENQNRYSGQRAYGLTNDYVSEAFLHTSPAQVFSGRSSISSMCNAVLERHQGEMWTEWEDKFVNHNMLAGLAQPTFTGKPFVLCEAKSFSVDPSLRNPNSGLLKCDLSVGKLFLDLNCSSIMYIVLLCSQLLDTSSWTSLNGSKKPSNSSNWSVNNAHCSDKGWEELYELYTEKMKHIMLTLIPEKIIHLTAVIAGPKIQLSSSSTQYLKFQKQTTLAESHASFVFVIDLGNLEVAIWPAAHIEALTFAEEHNRYNRFEPGHDWLKELPHSDLSVRSDSYTHHEKVGSNAYLKLENAVVLLENKSEDGQLRLVEPFTITVQSSVCRDQFTSLITTEKTLLASVGCTVSAITIMCPVDELSLLIQVLEDHHNTFHTLVTGRDANPSQELHACSEILYSNNEYLECMSGKFSLQTFGMANSALLTSFAVVVTFDLKPLDVLFKVSRGNLVGHGLKEVDSGFRNGKQYKIRKEKQSVGNSWRWHDFPITDTMVSSQKCVVEFSLGDKKQAEFFLGLYGIHARIYGSAIEPSRNLRGQVPESKTSPVKATETHTKVLLTQFVVHSSTLNLFGGPYVSDQILLEGNSRTNIGSGINSQIGYASQSADCVLPVQTFKTQLNEPTLASEQNRSRAQYPDMDLQSPISSCWLRVDLDVSECFITDSPLEVLISEAMLKLSGSKRMHALFRVGKEFQTVSGCATGGILVLQTEALAILMESYRAYQIFMKGFASSFVSFIERPSVGTSEVSGMKIIMEEGISQRSSHHTSRPLSFPIVSSREDSQLISGMHGVHAKRPFIETLSFRVQQFSVVLAHVDVSDGAQGILLEMDLSTMFAHENQKDKLSFDLSRLMILGLHPNINVTKGKEKAGEIPHFGSTSSTLCSNDAKQLVNLQLPLSATNLSGRNESDTSSDQVVQETLPRRDASSSSYVPTDRDCHILECMTALFSIERNLAVAELGRLNWRDGWNGQCSISGVALTFTTSEILMLLSLTSPISELSSGDKVSNLQTMATYEYMETEENELECKIPNGAIVAIKDVQEHLFLAVENVERKHRLTGVLHYTLASDGAALFRVKYQDQRLWRKSQSWFSLLSLTAKNDDGEPYRVHCCPGSSLVDISSTNDKSCELWRIIPFKYKAEDDIEEHDIYRQLCKKMLHFINKKSGNSLAFVNSRPQLVKQPGNPFKIKIFSPAILTKTFPIDTLLSNALYRDGSLNLNPSEEQTSAVITTSVPQVKVIVNTFAITILYEASGAIHFLPLLRLHMDSAESVAQISSYKIRIINSFKIRIESYEAQTDTWMKMLREVEICIVYRARLVQFDQKDIAFEKMLISFYSILKQVDLLVSEPSLDICLFLVGELKLAGPYTIRHSPVTANCCKVVNNTGLDLLCCFDDNVKAKVAAWHTESFLIRSMVSRKYSHPESSTHMSLQLVKSGIVSSTPVRISMEELGVTTLKTRLVSEKSEKRAPGPFVVVDVSKQNEDGLSVSISPMVRIHNASGLSLELRCRRPQQSEHGGVAVLLKHGDVIDDSMGAFDAFNLAGELKKALLSFGLGNYLLCVRPVNDKTSYADSETPPSFQWSDDLKGVKGVRISGLFDKLSHHIKKTFYGQTAESCFSMIHCGRISDTNITGLYFLVRTMKKNLSVGAPHTPEHPKPQSPIVAFQEQQDILIMPTIQVSNLLNMKIAVTSETNSTEIFELGGNHAIVQSGQKSYMYADLSNLFLTVTLYDLKQRSSPINAGDWGKFPHKTKGEVHDLDIELDFGDGKHFAMLRLSRGDMGLLEAIIYTPYALQNDTDMSLICYASKHKSFSLWRRNDKQTSESGNINPLHPKSRISWFEKSDKILIRRQEENANVSLLDLENFSGFMEISLVVQEENGLKEIVKLGISSQLSSSKRLEPTHTICLLPRYIVVNQSSEKIFVCQYHRQETAHALTELSPGQRAMLHMKILPGEEKAVYPVDNIFNMHRVSGTDSLLFVQFSLTEPGWNWSGPICPASLGHFFLKMRSCSNIHGNSESGSSQVKGTRFAVVDVIEEGSSLIMLFNMQSPEFLPYRIDNSLRVSIQFHQKESSETDILKPGATVGYVWDDLNLPHILLVQVAGTQLQREISLDKLGPCKHFFKIRQSRGVGLLLQSGDHLEGIGRRTGNKDKISDEVDVSKVVYEIYADGPTRVLWIYEVHASHKKKDRISQHQIPYAKIDCKVSHLGISLLERGNQQLEVNNGYTPIIFTKFRSIMLELINATKHTLCYFKVETLAVEEKWQGAPFATMLRVRGQDYFENNEPVLRIFFIVSNHTSNPNQVKYSSVVLQAIDLHVDEDTLMKLVPFYRTSLAASTTSRREIYFEHFQIHPIKIVASFLPGYPRANYTSAQETLRAFLHSIIKIPAVKGTVVELNGLLLSHALMTFYQLAIKCAQHYSWYVIRAIYIAKGSQLLPPSFVSLFDDSASTSLDFFIDPSDHSVDLQNLTKGMFNLLRKGIGRKEYSGTNRYLGDLGRTIQTAGSNILFAAMREVSDNVMNGAETSGFDGMVKGFHRGILKLAMEPSVLSTAAVKGGSSYRIKLEHSANMDELYIEGYLQAMLDALFKQNYLRVKVVDDEVLLKNLPPNTGLINEIKQCVKNFLIGEGLLAGESSQAVNSLRRLHGESEWQVVPKLKAVCEQLFVIFAIRALRRQTKKILHTSDSNNKSTAEEPSRDQKELALPRASKIHKNGENMEPEKQSPRLALVGSFLISSAVAYIDGRLCRHIPNAIVRRIVSGFLLSFVEQS